MRVCPEIIRWSTEKGAELVRTAVKRPRAVVIRGVLDRDLCDELARRVWAEGPTPVLVPRRSENTVSFARNKWTRRLHTPAKLLRSHGVRLLKGQARLDLSPSFEAETMMPRTLLGGHKVNAKDSAIFVTSKGLRTPLHSDERHAVLLHVAGEKNFVVVPSADSDVDPHLLRTLLTLRDTPGLHADLYGDEPPNHAARQVRRFQGSLAPGDALFLPQRWLHDIESLTPTISISLRFGNWDAPNP